jgi:hypothetical protein
MPPQPPAGKPQSVSKSFLFSFVYSSGLQSFTMLPPPLPGSAAKTIHQMPALRRRSGFLVGSD